MGETALVVGTLFGVIVVVVVIFWAVYWVSSRH